MADKRISELDAVTTPAPTDEFPVVQSGNTRKMTREQIHTLESGEAFVGEVHGAVLDDGGAVINAKHPDYGAEGDGATDDATALAAALTAAAGGTLVLPAGTYLCSAAMTVDTARTHIRGEGDVVIRFTAATNGIHLTAQRCRLSNITLEAGHTGCLAGVLLNGTPSYAVLDNVVVKRQASASWEAGWDLENAQNLTAIGGWIDAHFGGSGGTITDCIVVQDEARGNSMFGVNITGRNNAGEFTSRGLYVQDGGGVRWFGGVIQGGFSVAAADVDGDVGATGTESTATAVSFYHPHIEITAGGGVGFRYDRSKGTMLVVSPDGGSVSVAPTGTARGFEIRGGLVADVTLSGDADSALIWPSEIFGTLTVDDAATGTVIGPIRDLSSTNRRSWLLNRGGAGELLQLTVDERDSSGQTASPELLWTAQTHDGDPHERSFRTHVEPSSNDGNAEWQLGTRLDGAGWTTRFGVNQSGTVTTRGSLLPAFDNTYNLGGAATAFKNLYVDEFWEGAEMSDPAAPSANGGRLYFRDNGSGKTQLVVRFATGAVQVIATEP